MDPRRSLPHPPEPPEWLRVPPPPEPQRTLPRGQAWIAHCGNAARRRYIKHQLVEIRNAVKRDPVAALVFARLLKATGGTPEEFGIKDGTWQNLALGALTLAHEEHMSWGEAMTGVLDAFENDAAQKAEA